MKASNQLYDLIKSLTPDEELHFKNSSSIQQGEKNYIKLYNHIKSQDDYDEEEVKKYFKHEVFIQHLASEKNQLLHHVLKSLRHYRYENSISAQVDEEIKNIQILFNKSLYKQSRKQLSIIKKKANDHELFYSLLDIIELEKSLIDMEAYYGDINYKTVDELIEEENTIFLKIENCAAFDIQLAKLNAISSKITTAIETSDINDIKQLLTDTKKLASNKNILSNKSKIIYLYTIGSCNRLLNNMDEVYKLFSDLIIEMENNPEIISEMPNYYILSHGSLIRYYAINQQYSNGFKLIEKLKSLSLNKMFKATDLQINIFSQSYITEMLLYCYIGEHDQAKKLIPLVIENLDKYDSKINNEDLLRIYHAIAMVYFGIGEFNKSLHWLNKIINQNYENLRQDIVRISKLIYLIVHFEIGNDDLLHYIYKSTLRFFNTQKNQHQFEAIFLNHFKKIAILKKENKQGDPYQLLKKELITVFKNSFEKNALEFFNFYAWLDSKTYSISFSDAIRLRKENL